MEVTNRVKRAMSHDVARNECIKQVNELSDRTICHQSTDYDTNYLRIFVTV